MLLTNAFRDLTDRRRAQGLRVTQEQVLTMVVVAYVCGYFSYRKMETFSKAHSDLFTEALDLKHPVPSFMTFRDIIVNTDQAELIAAFNLWAKDLVHNEDNNGVTSGNAPVVLAVCSTIAINIHRKEGYDSISYGQIKFGARVADILKIIKT